jgi:hypothetical protein
VRSRTSSRGSHSTLPLDPSLTPVTRVTLVVG